MRVIDLVGQRFHKLTVLAFDHVGDKRQEKWWRCLCDCGQEVVLPGHRLRTRSKSCGCLEHARRDVEERFWEKVDQTLDAEACWLWVGSTTSAGYGQFSLPTGLSGRDRTRFVYAHRFAYELVFGPFEGYLLHKCDTPRCVNPWHLRPGTQKENMDDALAKGRLRHMRGETHPSAKVSDVIVDAIRKRVADGEAQVSVAKSVGLSQPMVSLIVNGKRRTERGATRSF